jgi:hypothetical protein
MNTNYSRIEPTFNGEGLDGDLICGDFKSMIHDISCMICMNVVFNPISCKTCQVMFCTLCINEWRKRNPKCPSDCSYVEAPLATLSKKLLAKIKLKCLNHTKGCKDEIFYEDYSSHINNKCDFVHYKCNANGCSFQANNKMITMHIKVCDYFDENCPYCFKQVVRKNLSEHIKICEFRTYECIYCSDLFTSSLLEKHKLECDHKPVTCSYCGEKYIKLNEDKHTKEVCFKGILTKINYFSDSNSDLKEKCSLLEKQKKKLESDKLNSAKNQTNNKTSNEKLVDQLKAEKMIKENEVEVLKIENTSLTKKNLEYEGYIKALCKNVQEWKEYSNKLEEKIKQLNANSQNNIRQNTFRQAPQTSDDLFKMFFFSNK